MVVGMLVTAGIAHAQAPTFSQTSVTVGVGQSTSVTSENGIDVYMDSNSGPTNVSVSANGTQATLTGLAPGSATITLCAVGTASDCTSLYITVQIGNVSSISFSESALSLGINSTQSVTVSGGSGTYSVSSNSNTTVASTNLSGSTLTVSGLASGGATITVCDTSGKCGPLSVTVGSSTTSGTGLTLSPSSVSLNAGGSQIVSVSGGNGVYEISNNSNASVASAGLSGTTGIVVDGVNSGSGTITVCDTSNTNTCGTVSVTVTGSTPSENQGVTFSVTNPTVAVGQSVTVQLSGGATTYVVLWNQNAGLAQASVTNSTLSINGLTAGTDSLTICATAGGCSPLSVTVTGSSSATSQTTTAAPVTTTPATTVPAIQPGTATVNTTLLSEIQAVQTALTQTLSQIQAIQTEINQIEAQVNAGSGSTIAANTNVSAGTFTELLTVGSEDAQVTALQNRLLSLGFYSGPVTGYYGALTESAVMKYQTSHGIEATGEVGPDTRAALNAGN